MLGSDWGIRLCRGGRERRPGQKLAQKLKSRVLAFLGMELRRDDVALTQDGDELFAVMTESDADGRIIGPHAVAVHEVVGGFRGQAGAGTRVVAVADVVP